MARSKKGEFLGVPVARLAAVTGGAVAAKAVNAPLSNILSKVMPEGAGGRTGRTVLAGAKIFAGAYANKKMKSQMIKDAGLGMMMVGGLEILEEYVPQLNINGVGIFEDYEQVGNVVEIDLDRLNGGGAVYNSLEDTQEVLGVQDYSQQMELAGLERY